MRIVKIGSVYCKDPTPSTIFPSMTRDFKFAEPSKQVLDVTTDCSTDVRTLPMHPNDVESTKLLRSNISAIGRFLDVQRLRGGVMPSYEDGASMLLPLDNKLGKDWLTYRDPDYIRIVQDLVRRVMRHAPDEAYVAISKLLTDYSYHFPYSNVIRQDGAMKVDESVAPDEKLNEFVAHFWPKVMRKADDLGVIDAVLPPLNASKSPGICSKYPDGRPFDRSEHYFVPKSLWTEIPNNLFRYNYSELKLAWCDTGALLDNLEFFMANDYADDKVFIEAVERLAASVHTEAYRINNCDEQLFGSDSHHIEKDDLSLKSPHPKNRMFAYESNYNFVNGKSDLVKWQARFQQKNPDCKLGANKKRPIYPAPNASISVPFTYLFRRILYSMEESCNGFPANRDQIYAAFKKTFVDCDGWGRCVITFDRSNSEQFVSDNFDKVLKLIPRRLRKIVKNLAKAVIPSFPTGRVINGCLISGTAQTTFLNVIVGCFTMCRLIEYILSILGVKVPFAVIVDKYVDCVLGEAVYMDFGTTRIKVNLGTDDQVLYVFSKNISSDKLEDMLKSKVSEYFSKRSLGGECSASGLSEPVFGMAFKANEVVVSSVLGLNKLFLMEKATNGDHCAFKMHSRIMCLPDYYDDIAGAIYDNGGGDIETYKQGEVNFARNLRKFGFTPNVDELLNEYSPVDQLVLGTALSKIGFKIGDSARYPRDAVEKFEAVFRRYKVYELD